MDFKKIAFISLLFPSLSLAMTLKLGPKIVELTLVKNYWITKNCKSCQAQKSMESLNKKEVQTALSTQKDETISIGNRLCHGLKGSVWSLKNEKEEVWSVCEFADGSAVLTDDLAEVGNKSLSNTHK